MITHVWSKRDFVAVGLILAGVLVLALGWGLDSSVVTAVGFVIVNLSWVVLVAWRIVGGSVQRPRR